jgi:hypothetical protein
MDYQGIAILLASITGFLTVVLGFVLQVLILLRQAKQSTELTHVKDLVNGQSTKLNAALQKGALAEGIKLGAEQERANPLTPTIAVPEAEKK